MRGKRWSPAATNALELLYNAGWRWSAIAAHCTAVSGHPRSVPACQRRAQAIGITRRDRLAWKRLPAAWDDDLMDMMVMDYSMPQMAAEMRRQHGASVTQGWIHKRLTEIGGAYYAAWQKRKEGRHSRGVERGWMNRRNVA